MLYKFSVFLLLCTMLTNVVESGNLQHSPNGFLTVRTNKTQILFERTGLGLIYHGIDPSTGNPTENAFVVDFGLTREITPDTHQVVQQTPPGLDVYNVTLAENRQPENGSDLIYEDAFRVDMRNDVTQTVVTFWIFTKDQTVTDIKLNRTMEVVEGSLKYSIVFPLWPFLNNNNKLDMSANISMLIPNTMTGCYGNPDDIPGVTSVICKASGVSGALVLFNRAIAFSYETFQPNFLNVEILFFACPVRNYPVHNELVDGALSGFYCNYSVTQDTKFPADLKVPEIYSSSYYSSSSDESNSCDEDEEERAAIDVLELIIRVDNFVNAALDYDPEISVLFDGGSGGSGGCNSDSYNVVGDYIFWSSLGCAILALCIIAVVTCVGTSTSRGRRWMRGRDDMKVVMKNVRRRTSSYYIQESQSTNPMPVVA